MNNIQNQNIKFIYLDLGGVAILDFSGTNKWNEMMDGIGIPEVQRDNFKKLFKKHEPSLLIGGNPDNFIRAVETEIDIKFPENYSLIDDFVDRFEPNYSIQAFLDQNKDKYKFGLLTNAYKEMLSKIISRGILPKVEWERIVDSSEVGMQKPDLEIYELATKLSGVTPNEILFVDNKEENLINPPKLGWNVFYYDSNNIQQSNKNLINLLG